MNGNSNEPVRDSDRIRFHEPVTIRLYGIKEISLPTYLMWYLATIIVVVALIAGCNEIMQPQTGLGERVRRSIEREGWGLDAVAWTPTCLVAGLVFELFEGAFVMYAFRRRFQQLRSEHRGTA
ncbi:MAG: hypothetical protein ACKVHE_02585 [Planctomycetales bacterium]|jgi:hypothetical protein